ncbi:uncharacterized protein BT62DRAFT_933850 [Guyanagaster necrorhizus]|uniref:Fungal-type protein kinase domain-containing protein n=1 Tax=Guyanagaster necrorhizus TaxID=856835 RepID=A0A9P8AQX3_9AGAR|nr:uncharacterized protein BT62DRAFT_933850 [Guyanagaster necrorhizus MCA 3950]KAG7444798.1 hypothetical protein BT62DRAFT_933850 [Guyanagaster necrorhizus MCA 3950]
MVVAAFFLGAMSVSDLTGARSPSLDDPNPSSNVPFTPKNGAPSTSANDDETNPKTTPYNFGAASHRAFHMKYERKDYDNFIREDLESRVFIPSDDFLRVILHLPRDWRQDSTISALIKKVKADEQWKALWDDYKAECKTTDETNLYHPHNSLCNRALALIKDGTRSGPDIGFYRQDPQPVKGSNVDLKPDAITLLLSLFNSSQNNIEDIKTGGPKNNIGWPQLLQWLEFKLSFTTLDNGRYATRVLTAGKFLCSLMYIILLTRYLSDKKDPMGKPSRQKPYMLPGDPEGVGVVAGQKRKSDKQDAAARSRMQEEAESERLREIWKGKDDKNKEDPRLQCARYAMEVLSSAGFRTHSIGALIGGTHLQMLYYDRSSIIVSQEIDMDNDPDSFIAMLIGLHGLTLEKHGIHSIIEDPFLSDYGEYTKEHQDDTATLFEGRKLTLKKSDGTPVVLTLGKIIFRQPGIIGRDTCVVEATAEGYEEWKGMETIVKISWQAKSRPSEKDFMNDVKTAVDKMSKDGASHHWVADHLPNILLSQDFEMAEDSPQARLKEYFDAVSYADGGSFNYEERVCRVMVQERLYSITSLREPRQYAQGIFDILQVHKWVYDHAKIIHRDISMTNLMWRKRNGVICGVLNDFDLSSYRDRESASALRRTGTGPYYACDLLKEDPPVHIYRHDVESIFNVLVLLCCRYEIQATPAPEGKDQLVHVPALPFESWYDMSYLQLHDKKFKFFIMAQDPDKLLPASISFSDFKPWLMFCYSLISEGLFAAIRYERNQSNGPIARTLFSSITSNSEPAFSEKFDDATLGGFVDYPRFFKVMCKFAGQDLTVKYNPNENPYGPF